MSERRSESERLAHAIELLIGAREQNFWSERELRMFQLQSWLLGTEEINVAFNRAGVIITSALLSKLMKGQKQKSTSASERLIRACASEKLRGIIDESFRNFTIFTLFKVHWEILDRQLNAEIMEEIAATDAFIGIKIGPNKFARILSDGDVKKVLSEIQRRAPKGENESPNDEVTKNGWAGTTSAQIYGQRKKQGPFLFAASVIAPDFLQFDFDSELKVLGWGALLDQVTAKSKETDKIRAICGGAMNVASLLGTPLSREVLDVLAGIKPELSLEELPSELLEAAGIQPKKPRRSPSETRAGQRRPVRKI
jgi:hypothetical protein